MTEADNTAPKQHGRPWPKGVSGNPAGCRNGSRHRATILAEHLLQTDFEDVCNAVVSAAKKGDMTAAKIIVERLVPPRKDRPISFALPKLETADDAAAAMAAVAQGVANGELTPLEARDIAAIVESFVKVREINPKVL